MGPEHIPDPIRMATDPDLNDGPSESSEVWAPVHAWRILGLLQAEAAAGPLTGLFRRIDDDDDDAVGEELPKAFGVLGPAAIPVLTQYLLDKAHGVYARVAAAHSLAAIGGRHAEARLVCIDALAQALARPAGEGTSFNAFVISFLIELRAVEAQEVMARAFAAEAVDEGSWVIGRMCKSLWDSKITGTSPATKPPVRPPTSTAEFEARAA